MNKKDITVNPKELWEIRVGGQIIELTKGDLITLRDKIEKTLAETQLTVHMPNTPRISDNER